MAESNKIIDDLIGQGESVSPATTHESLNGTSSKSTSRAGAPMSANDVAVHIANRIDPIVILFGPSGCGKTMLLLRLAHYLDELHLKVKPRADFRPMDDRNYNMLCASWDDWCESDLAALPTSLTNFMLLTVAKRNSNDGGCICQILEAPGELYFDPEMPVNTPFPPYLESIKNSHNRKIWCIMLEPEWENPKVREKYVERISRLKRFIKPQDSVIVVYNKVDLTDLFYSGKVRIKGLERKINEEYPGLFEVFKNENPITKFINPYFCSLLPFSTGSYAVTSGGAQLFTPGDDVFPRNLWETIRKKTRG